MKSCRKHTRPAAGRQAVQADRETVQNVPVHRYSHPICTKSPARETGAEGLLKDILEALARQSELLEELLGRTGGDKRDTK